MCVRQIFLVYVRLKNDGSCLFKWQTGVWKELERECITATEVSSDVSLANLTARQQPQGKQQQTSSVVYSQLNTNPAACLPLAFTLGWEIKPAHQPNIISFSLWLIRLSTEPHTLTSTCSEALFCNALVATKHCSTMGGGTLPRNLTQLK